MNLKEIKEMIALMNENNLTELELERDGLKIRLKKSAAGGYTTEQIIVHQAPAGIPAMQGQIAAKEERVEVPSGGVQIKAPMVGTFYKAPSPDAAPYVDVGSSVEVGQVICIIEAMKLMNEIKSEIKGKVVKILADNGSPVEFGQPLFLIEA